MISAAHSWQLSVRPPAGDLLLENRSLDFSRYFTHLKSQEPATDKLLLLTAILAEAINLGLTKIGGVPRFLRSLGFLGCRRGTSGFGLLYGSGNDILDCKAKFLYELLQRR